MQIIEHNNLDWSRGLTPRAKTTDLILHHSGSSYATVEDIDTYHKGKGWSGIAYHYLVRKDGTVHRGRPENTIGGHTYGFNSASIGICFEGHFSKETMSDIQIKAGQDLIADIQTRYTFKHIGVHREYNPTECAGNNFPLDKFKNVSAGETVTSGNDTLSAIAAVMDSKGLPAWLWLPIASVESGFDPNAHALTSQEDSRGIFQINVVAHPQWASTNLFDPAINAQIAADNFLLPAYSYAVQQTSEQELIALIVYSGKKDPRNFASKGYIPSGGIRPAWNATSMSRFLTAYNKYKDTTNIGGINTGTNLTPTNKNPQTDATANTPTNTKPTIVDGIKSSWLTTGFIIMIVIAMFYALMKLVTMTEKGKTVINVITEAGKGAAQGAAVGGGAGAAVGAGAGAVAGKGKSDAERAMAHAERMAAGTPQPKALNA